MSETKNTFQIPDDEKWISIYLKRPQEGQVCASKIVFEEGYVGRCIFHNGYFETYEEHRNRLVITRWKNDLWLPIESFTGESHKQ